MNKAGIAAGIVLLALAGCAASKGGDVVRRGDSTSANGASGAGDTPTGNGLIVPSSTGTGSTIIAQAGHGAPAKLDPNVCASAQVAATRVTPEVYFVVDGSSSMNSSFGSGTRWSVLRDALVGPSGVVTKLEAVVKFGMAIYSNSDPSSCPAMTDVAADLNNLMALSAAYPSQEPGGGTPTGEALQKVIDGLPAFGTLDSTEQPPIIILATDGEPNGCDAVGVCNWAADWAACLGNLGGQLAQLAAAPATYDTTLAAVRAARDKNVAVWVISLADGLNNIPDLQRTANIGAGLAEDASPGATIYSPQNPDELTQTLAQLIGDAVTCDISLAGSLDVDRACEGLVQVNSQTLDCNSDQGWKVIDSSHIALQGMACERFKSDPTVMLNATFPCDVVDLK